MAGKNNILRISLSAMLVSCAVSCTGVPFLVPNPPGGGGAKIDTAAAARETPQPSPSAVDTIDFASAFRPDTGPAPAPAIPAPVPQITPSVPAEGRAILQLAEMIRVAILRNLSRTELQAAGTLEVRSPSLSSPARCSGRIVVEKKTGGRAAISVNGGPPHEVALPCSLLSTDQSALITAGGGHYRGSMIVSGTDQFSVINLVPVEEYLRGVVPLEMGNRTMAEMEALKAQAVAARTYAYKHMAVNKRQPYDVVNTVADQVYGGADAETAESNYAVNATGGLVLWWRDSLADAFFHSTCGGRTASASEVWGSSFREYLVSKSDIAPDGKAYCSFAPSFTWEESWDAAVLSKIVRSTVPQNYPDAHFTGSLRTISVAGRFGCGRVKLCRLNGTEGSLECGGDRVRFVLRRGNAGGDILRSARFTVEKNGPQVFMLRGQGYGHGVGMCQMGAIGRARSGQKFEQILQAYFSPAKVGRIQRTPVAR